MATVTRGNLIVTVTTRPDGQTQIEVENIDCRQFKNYKPSVWIGVRDIGGSTTYIREGSMWTCFPWDDRELSRATEEAFKLHRAETEQAAA